MTPDPSSQTAPVFAHADDLVARLRRLSETGTPQVGALAAWLADRPEELAFHSVRTLATRAETNANTVIRLARALGFAGFEPCRAAAQQALRGRALTYGARVGALAGRDGSELEDELLQAARATVEGVFAPELAAAIRASVPLIRQARQVHCVGVRGCFGLASYFTYIGSLAHANIMPTPGQPGLIMDSLAECDSRDVVIAITFPHYSSEVVRAAGVARAQGSALIAITDSHSAPIARGATVVLRPPMLGPHVMPSLSGAFLLIETLLAHLAAQDPQAQTRVRRFEERLLRLGAYVSGAPDGSA
ncbi:MAG: RpiR family transcriptional regulator [Rhodobacteraceae bacterium HLUCCA12]|nr:MAG: RpiR family transcriptional regulator [Rhodobacteraceae bacterium HLUCCA12]